MLDRLKVGAGDRVLVGIDEGMFYLRPLHKDPIAYLAKKAEIFGRSIPKSKRGATDRQIMDATAKLVVRKIAHD